MNNFFVSDSAVAKISQDLAKNNKLYLRVGVRGSGCSGHQYFLEYQDADISIKDLEFLFKTIKIVIDSKSIKYLDGATLDYQTSLMKSGFVFHNPNAQSTCGCGESFSTKHE